VMTALLWASHEGHAAMVECLLKHGANFDCQDEWVRTFVLCRFQHLKNAATTLYCVLSYILIARLFSLMLLVSWAYGKIVSVGAVIWVDSHSLV
jgi:hypothetical protein